MRQRRFILAFAMLGLLSACGSPAGGVPIAPAPDRPTAFTVAAGAATTQPAATAPVAAPASEPTAAPATPTLVPTTVPPTPTAVVDITGGAGSTASDRADFKIVIDAPAANVAVSSPLAIRGSANFWPFEATLVAQLKDASGAVLAMQPVMVQSPDAGQGGPWSDEMRFTSPATAQQGTLEIFETSAKDGSILTFASVKVQLAPGAQPGTALTLEHPNEGASVTLPLHVSFGGARGDEQLALRLQLADGTVHERVVRADLGYVVETLPAPNIPGAATLEVARGDGTVVARRELRVAAPEETQTVKVAWLIAGEHEEIVMQEKSVPRSPQVATAALNELLWGPAVDEAGYVTALPTPDDVLGYTGRTEGWGARVRLLKLTIENGVALANFSPELRAYGGGAARVSAIRQQIERTLLQFPSVQQVVIAVDGVTEGVLEP